MAYNKTAESGNIFVLTEKGYWNTPDKARKERKAGSPVKGYEYSASWIEKGYVEEVAVDKWNTS